MTIFLVLLSISLAVRLLVVKDAIAGFDTTGHLYFAKEVKSQGVSPFDTIKLRIVASGDYRQPFLWHWLVGRLPIVSILRHQKYLNSAIDGAFAVSTYYFAVWINLPDRLAFLVFLLYLLTPMWFSRLAIGPRIAGFTPRLFAEMCTNLFFVVTFLPLPIGTESKLALGTVLSCFVLLSSKFGVQALLFLVPLAALIGHNFLALESFFLSILLSFAITKGAFIRTLASQVEHLAWYFKRNIQGKMAISDRNSLKLLFARDRSQTGLKQLEVSAERWIVLNSFTSTLIKMPVVAVVSVLLVLSVGMHGEASSIPITVVAPVLAATMLFLLINIPHLLFLGEAERYLNHVAVFIVLSLVMLLGPDGNLHWIIYFLIGYGLVYWMVEAFFLKIFEHVQRKKEAVNCAVIVYLQGAERHHSIVCYPYHAVGVWRIMLETQHSVVYPLLSTGRMREFETSYPFVDLSLLDEMHAEYGIDLLVISRKSLGDKGLDSWKPSSRWTRADVGAPLYEIYVREESK
jgi:hypothetical protein